MSTNANRDLNAMLEQDIARRRYAEAQKTYEESDPYKNSSEFAVNLPKFNEIDYGKERRDEAIKTLKPIGTDALIPDVNKSMEANAPELVTKREPKKGLAGINLDTTAPKLETEIDTSIVKETPKEVVKEAKDADEWSKYINSLYSESDREADEKKKKAAKWVLAAQMLGDTFSALANSYYTSKGANAMTAPSGSQKAAEAAGKLEMDIRNARKTAEKEKMDAMLKKFDMDMKKENLKLAREQMAQTQSNADRAYQLSVDQFEYKKTQDALAQQNWQTMNQQQLEQWNKNYELEKKKLAQQWARTNAENAGIEIQVGDGFVTIPKKRINEATIGKIYDMCDEKLKDKSGKPIYETVNGERKVTGYTKPDLNDMLVTIGIASNTDEGVQNAIRNLAGVGKPDWP